MLSSVLLFAGCAAEPSAEYPGPLLVFAAASTTDAVTEVLERFQDDTGIPVQGSFAASSALAQQIAAGAPADVFLSANADWIGFLEERGRIASRTGLLGNSLVAIVPTGSGIAIEEPADLLNEEVQLIAIGDPQGVPAGMYAKQTLEQLQLWDKLQEKLVPTADVRQALLYVEQQEADAGIVYATDAAISDQVQIARRFPEEASPGIIYPLVLLDHSARKLDAQRLYAFMQSPEAAKIFRDYGFEGLNEPVP